MSILEKLFNSKLFSEDGFCPNKHPKYRELSEEARQYEEYFNKKLSKEDWGKMDRMIIANFGLGGLSRSYCFQQGFKLATAIWREAFADSNF